jgi:protein-S-isoprenylcysteine O-methyltransferase Ste14
MIAFERRLTPGKDNAECWTAIYATIGRDAPEAKESKPGTPIATYDYRDANGEVIYQAVRYEPKGFSQRRPDGKGGWVWNMDGVTRVPFNLPVLVRANVALIAEGEKDAVNLQKAAANFPDENGKLSYGASCNIGGAGKWLESYSPYLAGKKTFVFQDNDDPGHKHAQQVCASVSNFAQAVHLVRIPGLAEHGDVSDYLEAHTPAELFALMQAAPVWTPPVQSPDIAAPTGDKKPEGGFRLVGIGELLSRPEVPPDFLVDGLLVRGTVSVVVAKPKVGKSTFARGLALAVARGEPFLGRITRQGACIYLALEERHEEITADFRAMGAIVAVFGYVLFVVARLQLGASFSVSPQAKELVTHGLYARIRNPIYVFVVVMWVGLIVALHLYWLFMPFLALLLMQLIRAGREAKVLQERFGQAYLDYREQTWF